MCRALFSVLKQNGRNVPYRYHASLYDLGYEQSQLSLERISQISNDEMVLSRKFLFNYFINIYIYLYVYVGRYTLPTM